MHMQPRRRTVLRKQLVAATVLALGLAGAPASAAPASGEPYPSTVSLRLTDHLVANGRIRFNNGRRACFRDRLIRVHYRTRDTDWIVTEVEHADRNGEYHIEVDDLAGRYMVIAKQRRLPNGDLCQGSESDVERHTHGG